MEIDIAVGFGNRGTKRSRRRRRRIIITRENHRRTIAHDDACARATTRGMGKRGGNWKTRRAVGSTARFRGFRSRGKIRFRETFVFRSPPRRPCSDSIERGEEGERENTARRIRNYPSDFSHGWEISGKSATSGSPSAISPRVSPARFSAARRSSLSSSPRGLSPVTRYLLSHCP